MAEAAPRDVVLDLLAVCDGDARSQADFDEPRRDNVDVDAVLSQLQRQRLRQEHQARLRRAVVRCAASRRMMGAAGNQAQLAPARLADHLPGGGARSSFSTLASSRATRSPTWAKRVAMARPIPSAAPVTTTLRGMAAMVGCSAPAGERAV